MSQTKTARRSLVASLAALTMLAGCNHFSARPRENDSASLMDSGRSPKITTRQAADIQVAIGRSKEEEGKLNEARDAYLAAVKRDPKRADAEARLAILFERKGEIALADKHFDRALKLNPKDAELLCDRGYSFYLRRRWSDSETALRKAIATSPDHARSHNNLGLVLARSGNTQKALAEFAKGGCDPADSRANLALVLALEGRFEESQQEYKLALVAKPKSAKATEGLKAATVALSDQRDPKSLTKTADPALKADSSLTRTSAQ